MTRRANGEGTIYKRSDGRWCASVSLDLGKRKSFYGKTRQVVAHKLAAAIKARQDGLPLPGERQTVAQYLTSWVEGTRSTVRPRTFSRYEGCVRLHIIPVLGKVPLARLSPQHLQRLYENRLQAGLSPASVGQVHAVFHRALEQATRWGLVPRNVADLVSRPKSRRREMTALSPEQSKMLLAAASGERLEALYVLAVTTGMRQGELLALKWSDVELENGSVQIRGSLQPTPDGLVIVEPKTVAARRNVSLTGVAVEALRKHRASQAEERLRLGAAWDDRDMVFPNAVGRPMDVRSLARRSFLPLLEAAGLPRMRFHDLRHTAATLLLGQGVHPKVVAEMLGHARISTTLDLYSHVTPTMQKQATEALDQLLSGS